MADREEIVIAFNVNQQQLDNVMQSMPVKFAATARKSRDAFANSFEGLASKLASSLQGGLTGVAGALGVGMLFGKLNEQIDKFENRMKEVRLGVLRTSLGAGEFQAGTKVFKGVGLEGAFEGSLEKVAAAVAQAGQGGDEGNKMASAMIELGASLETIEQGDYINVFRQIAANMHSAELSAEKIAALRGVFGRSGPELMLAFRKGLDEPGGQGGHVTEADLKMDEIREDISDRSDIFADELKNTLLRPLKFLRDIPGGFFSIFSEMIGAAPGKMDENKDAEAELGSRKAEREKEALAVKHRQRVESEALAKQAKVDSDIDKDTARINADMYDRSYRARQKQLSLEDQIAQAKKLQLYYEKESQRILESKALQLLTSDDRNKAARAAADALKFREEAESKQKEADADAKEKKAKQTKDNQEFNKQQQQRLGFTIEELVNMPVGMRDRFASAKLGAGLIQDQRDMAQNALEAGDVDWYWQHTKNADLMTSNLNANYPGLLKPSEAEAIKTALKELGWDGFIKAALGDGGGISVKPTMGP